MLIRTFKKGYHWLVFLLVPVGILLWADGFLAFRDLEMGRHADAPLYALLATGLAPYPIIQILLGFGLVFFQAVLINGATNANYLFGKQTWLPGLMFLVLASSDPALLGFHPVIPANLFLILALVRLMDALDKKDPTLEVFNMGILISLAALFYFPAFVFLGWLLVVLGRYLMVSFRSIVASILGFLTPFLLLGTWWFLTDRLIYKAGEVAAYFKPFLIFSTPLFPYTKVFIVLIGLLTILAFIWLKAVYLPDKPVRIRKRFGMVFYFFYFSLAASLFVQDHFDVHQALFTIPLSLFVSALFLEMRKKWLAELLLYVLLGTILLGKFTMFRI